MSPNTRKIGNDAVSPIGFGLMALSAFYGAIENDEERFKVCALFLNFYFSFVAERRNTQVLDAALEEGCTFWDSADVYGDNEDLLGKWCFLAIYHRTYEELMEFALQVQKDGEPR